MKFGVPLVPLVVLLLPGLHLRHVAVHDGELALRALSSSARSRPAYVWMRIVTSHDDQRLTQMALKLKLAVRNPNRVLRNGARSYAPVGYRGGRNVWRR
jgi:hypothetical protein